MSDLPEKIAQFMAELERRNASPMTVQSYSSDLRDFVEYLTPPGEQPPDVAQIDLLHAARISRRAIRSRTRRPSAFAAGSRPSVRCFAS